MISDEDMRLLDNATPEKLAQWWCMLNLWDWPAEGIGDPEPPVKTGVSSTRRGEIMGEIMTRIGSKECLREWNREIMPGKDFDVWWEKEKNK